MRQKKNRLFQKTFMQTLRKVAEVMPLGFTDEAFFDYYSKCYPYMLKEATVICKDNHRFNRNRIKHGHKTVRFPNDSIGYFKSVSHSFLRGFRHKQSKGKLLSSSEMRIKRLRLES